MKCRNKYLSLLFFVAVFSFCFIYNINKSESAGGFLWSTSPYCYKHTGPASPKQLKMANTCNAGYFAYNVSCGHHTCCASVYMYDCGVYGARCNTATPLAWGGPCAGHTTDGPLAGCLNYKCRSKPNSIWDPMSKKCGCG